IEILVKVGDVIAVETSLVTLESDKASMEVPSPKAGKITALKVNVGDKVSEGMPLAELELGGDQTQSQAAPVETVQELPLQAQPQPLPQQQKPAPVVTAAIVTAAIVTAAPAGDLRQVYAGPAVRKLA